MSSDPSGLKTLLAGCSAGGAEADEIEPMVVDGEARAFGDAVGGAVEVGLEPDRDGEVGDVAATRADEMVVVLGEVFGELVARELVRGDDAVHDAGAFEDGEVPVDGALREARAPLEELGNGQRLLSLPENLDDGAATGRVALIIRAEAFSGDRVQLGDHPRSVPVLRTNENQVGFDSHSHSL